MHRVTTTIAAGLATSSLACLGATALAATTSIPSTTRQVVVAKDADGRYGWSLVQAAVPRSVIIRCCSMSVQSLCSTGSLSCLTR
jgi:hypothetical protein